MQSAAAIGNITLQIDDAPPVAVPLLQPLGLVALVTGLSGLALARVHRSRA